MRFKSAGLGERGGLKIRRMEIKDLDEVMEIEHASFPTPWSRSSFEIEITRNPNAFYIVAEFRGKVVGFAGMWITAGEGHVTNIAVHPKFRRCGLGELLLISLIERCIAERARGVILEVRERNVVAQELYRKCGFVQIGRRRHYYLDTGEDALVLYLSDLDRPEVRERFARRWEELWDHVPDRLRDRDLV